MQEIESRCCEASTACSVGDFSQPRIVEEQIGNRHSHHLGRLLPIPRELLHDLIGELLRIGIESLSSFLCSMHNQAI
jgi:hypothetical protein